MVEFLNEVSLKRLGILSLPTCVGLRYGLTSLSLEVFLGSLIRDSWLARRLVSPSGLGVNENSDFPELSSYTLRRPSIRALSFHSCVTPSYKRNQSGSGILTGFPSPTPFGLGLGID